MTLAWIAAALLSLSGLFVAATTEHKVACVAITIVAIMVAKSQRSSDEFERKYPLPTQERIASIMAERRRERLKQERT